MANVSVQLISAVLSSKKDLLDAQQRGISGAHFDGELRTIWEWITSYNHKYGKPPTKERLKEEFPSFKTVDTSAPLNDLIERVQQNAAGSFIAKSILDISDLIGDGRLDEAVERYLRSANQLSGFSAPGNVVSFKDSAERRYKDYIRSVKEGFDPMGLRIGIEPIDKAFLGLQRGDFVPVVGRLEMGKSTFAQFVTVSLLNQEKTVLIMSFEMSARAYVSRLDSMMSAISYRRMRELHLRKEEKVKWKNAITRLSSNSGDVIVIDSIARPTPSSVANYIDIYQPDIVILDQMPLMRPDIPSGSRQGNLWENTTTLSRQTKSLASVKMVPILGLTQASRAAIEKGVRTETVGYSDAIMQDADKCIGIDAGLNPEERVFSTLKIRDFGRQKVAVTVNFDEDTMQFSVIRSEPLF